MRQNHSLVAYAEIAFVLLNLSRKHYFSFVKTCIYSKQIQVWFKILQFFNNVLLKHNQQKICIKIKVCVQSRSDNRNVFHETERSAFLISIH